MHDLVFKPTMTHIVFGGTFDPPHKGHRLVVERCLMAFPGAHMVVAPAAQPAGAYGQHKHPKASFKDRVAMSRLAFEDRVVEGRVEISEIEANLPTPNFTWTTLEALSLQLPKARLALLLGYDQLQNFAGWQKATTLIHSYDIVAIERPNTRDLPQILKTLEVAFGALTQSSPDVYSLGASSKQLYILTGAVSDAESRIARESMARAYDKAWMDPKVTEYIKQHKLYDESEAP